MAFREDPLAKEKKDPTLYCLTASRTYYCMGGGSYVITMISPTVDRAYCEGKLPTRDRYTIPQSFEASTSRLTD